MTQIANILPKAQAAVLSRQATIPESDWTPDFNAYAPDLVRLVREARAFESECRDWEAIGRWLTISGDVGTGKTYMAQQLFQRCRKYNPGDARIWYSRAPRPICVWLNMTDFAQAVKSGQYDLPEKLRSEFLVVIDDVGAAYGSEYIAEATYRVLNGRMDKWTIITTNLSGAEISSKLDPRIASRMIRDRNRFVRLESKDYALR